MLSQKNVSKEEEPSNPYKILSKCPIVDHECAPPFDQFKAAWNSPSEVTGLTNQIAPTLSFSIKRKELQIENPKIC